MHRLPQRHRSRATTGRPISDLRVRLTALACALVAASVLAFTSTARAAGDDASKIAAATADLAFTKVDTSRFPEMRIAFALNSEDTQLPDITIEENGSSISNINVYHGKLGLSESNPKNVLFLVIDASNTMRGTKIEQAKAAAKQLIDQTRKGDRIGIVSYGTEAEMVMEPTDDVEALKAAVDDIEITFGTSMFEAVKLASEEFPGSATRRMVVLLADGQSLRDNATPDEALAAAKKHKVEIFSVGLQGKVFMPDQLEQLSASTDGTFQAVSKPEDLQRVYAELGRSLLRGFWLEYRSSRPGGEAVKLTMHADGFDDTTYSYTPPVIKGKGGAIHITAPPKAPASRPALTMPGGRVGQTMAAIPFGIVLAMAMWLYLEQKSRPNLGKRIEPYTKRMSLIVAKQAGHRGKAAVFAPLFKLTDALLGRTSLFRKFRFMLEQANLPLREVELLYMMFAGLLIGSFFGFVLFRSLVGVLIIGGMGLLAPFVWVRFKARKRKKSFEEQLADVLQTIAASLKAGHSFNQAINAVIKDAPNPTAEELQRVMTEARLGLPIEDALDAMARRMGSVDFDFAVTTVNIQRTVGGSLSEILEMVADTVRGRQVFRKKVKALSSMGRMSAYVLLAMPPFIAGMISLINREYMEPLFYSDIGHMMLYVGTFMMFLGYVACMKIVNIKI